MTASDPLDHLALQQLELRENSQIQAPSRPNATVHQIFEIHVEQTPDEIALVFPTRGSISDNSTIQLSYRELNRRANILAAQLLELGVSQGNLIAVYMQRSIETIVAFLGILKAGAAYVPLDLSYPKERLEWMLEDSHAPVLLTQSDLDGTVSGQDRQVFCMDPGWGSDADDDPQNLSLKLSSESLAYVIYTSGSTGKPKGVCIPHRGIVRLVCGVDYTQLDSSRVLLQLASTSFDAATFEIWGALLQGAKLVLYPDTGMPEPHVLQDIIRTQGVTTIILTTSLFHAIIDQAPESLQGLKALLTGGEALSVPHAYKALQALSDTQILNCYGPTESTTFTTTYQMPKNFSEYMRSVPIGLPIANTTTYILDEQLQSVAVGAEGELYIGGEGLATGYLNRPELTAQRFIKNPFSNTAGSLLYKTGDRVRYLEDGNIDFIGRFDDQVKLRGFRIELGEIEMALLEFESAREAIVLVREVHTTEKVLVAYITKDDDVELDLGILREFLRSKLPEYMVPSFFVVLDKIPLTPNGKADRKALPLPEPDSESLSGDYIAPASVTEKRIAQIWCQILRNKNVSVEDNFFEIGGTSTLSLQVAARIQEALDVAIPIVKLYQYPTIRSLAKHIDAKGTENTSIGKRQDRTAHRKIMLQRQKEIRNRGLRG